MCGDAANPEQVSALLSGAKYDLLLTDPPYNANLKMLNDNFECLQDYLDWYDSWFQIALQHAKESASFYLWGYDKTYCEIKVMLNKYEQLKLSNIIIWDKVCFGRTLPKFKSNKETCLFYKKGEPSFNNQKMKSRGSTEKQFGKIADQFGNYVHTQYPNAVLNIFEGPCTDVWWDVPTNRGASKERLDWHPTQKPQKLFDRSICASTNENDIVLDLFGGTGTTIRACESLNRTAYVMELDPNYCQKIAEAWQAKCLTSLF